MLIISCFLYFFMILFQAQRTNSRQRGPAGNKMRVRLKTCVFLHKVNEDDLQPVVGRSRERKRTILTSRLQSADRERERKKNNNETDVASIGRSSKKSIDKQKWE